MKRVAIGLSGGVDSSVATLLLKRSGFDVVGVTMTLGRENEKESLNDARLAAERLRVPLEIIDLSSEWKSLVLDYLTSTYLRAETPNPCVRCNEWVKFGILPRYAFGRLGCDAFATGHYARLEQTSSGPILRRGADRSKDQSYFLYRVSADILSRSMLPLGGFRKDEIRKLASEAGLACAEKVDSQDFCGGEVKDLLFREGEALPEEGEIITVDGDVIGRHSGIWNYTVGQRKGLGIGGGVPYYVVRLDAGRNRVVVGRKEDAVVKSFSFASATWLGEMPTGDLPLSVKVRSNGEPKGNVRVSLLGDSNYRCEAPDGIAGVAPGQSAVFYDGDRLLGGGVISK